jgi:cbb3-type cytochrome oxidase subunit 1
MEGLAGRNPQGAPTSPWLSLGFFFVAFAGLIAAYAMLVVHADRVLLHYILPEGVAITHITVLGWATMVVMGALYQLAPVLVQADLASKRLAAAQLVVYVLGVGGLVESFALGKAGSLPMHGAVAVLAVVLFLVNMALTLRRIRVWSVPAAYLVAALCFLTATITLGFLYALAKAYGWFTVELDMVAMHAHLGIGGWLSLVLMGVSYRLFPMFSLARGVDHKLARANLALFSLSIAALAAGLALGAPRWWTLLAGISVAAGVLMYVADVYRMYRRRLRRRWDLYFSHVSLSLGALLLTAVAGLLLAAGEPAGLVSEPGWTALYAYLALGGWLTFAIMGHAYKIVPMLVWQACYRSLAAGQAPLLTEMYWHRLAGLSLAVYAAGFVGTAAGFALDEVSLLQVSALLALAGGSGFVANMVVVLAGGLRGAHARIPVPAAPEARSGGGG